MQNNSSSKRSWRRTRRQLNELWGHIPRGLVTAVSFGVLIIIGLCIVLRRQNEDLAMGWTIASIGFLGVLWPIAVHYRSLAITRRKEREMRGK